MSLEEILNELLDIANDKGGDIETNIKNIVLNPMSGTSKETISIIIKTKP